MKTENKHYIAAAIILLALAWWFRYDTHCVERACISYDRFTGDWILPADKIKD